MNRILAIFLLIGLLSSCNKEEENYEFTAALDIGAFHSITSNALPMIDMVRDSLIYGTPLGINATLTYAWGDSSGFPNQSDTVRFELLYDSASVDFDGRTKTGVIAVYFYPSSADYTYSMQYENTQVGAYTLDGSVVFEQDSYLEYEYIARSYGFKLSKSGATMTTDMKARVSFDGPGSPVAYKFEQREGIDSDNREFKWVSPVDVISPAGCNYPSEGWIDIRPKRLDWRALQFGDGVCDSLVHVEAGNTTLRFSLP